jgi:hypothetical protein
MPPGVRAVMRPWGARGDLARRIDGVEEVVTESRNNFDRYTAAGTRIRAGAAVAGEEKKPKALASAPRTKPVQKSVDPAARPKRQQPAVRPNAAPGARPGTKPAAPAPAVTTPPSAVAAAAPSQQADVPVTAGGRLVAGLAALLLPRKVGSALGLVSIGGGRGMMWFVDIDTILFNAVMIACAVVFFIGLRRGAWRDAFLWYLVVATIVITSALAYTVSNYGTLFRHRQMVVATLALIGIAAARPRPGAPRSGEAA